MKPDHADVYIQRARVRTIVADINGLIIQSTCTQVSLESEDVTVLMKAPDDLNLAVKLAPKAPHTLYCLGYTRNHTPC